MNSSNNNNTQSQITLRIVGVLLVLCGMITTSFGFTLRPIKPFPLIVKMKMTPELKLQQFLVQQQHKDPMLPVLMHGLKRYLAGAASQSKFDKAIASEVSKHKVSRKAIESMVKNWDALKPAFKERYFSKDLIGLDPKMPLNFDKFSKEVIAAAAQKGVPKNSGPLPRTLPAGIVHPPQITEVRTAGLDFVLVLRPGGEFTLIGRNFSAVAAQNQIQIGRVREGVGTVDLEVLHTLTPTSAATTQLRGIAPRALAPGDYNVRVTTNRSRSNLWPAYVETPPAPAARLDSISPGACQFPGDRILLRGDNFMPESLIQLEFIDADLTSAEDIRAGYRDLRVGRPMVDYRNRNEIFFTIPQETWPGDYQFSVVNPGAPSSLRTWFTVCTPSYRIELASIFCRDESDPEYGRWEDDDLAVTSRGIADNGRELRFATDEFNGFSDGVRRTFTGVDLFARGGDPVPVKNTLEFSYMLLEVGDWDPADKEEAMRTIGMLGGIAELAAVGVLAYLGATVATGIIVGSAIGLVVSLIILAVWLHDDAPDPLGGELRLFTAQQLQVATAASADRSFVLSASHRNHDDIGSYDMSYRIIRSH